VFEYGRVCLRGGERAWPVVVVGVDRLAHCWVLRQQGSCGFCAWFCAGRGVVGVCLFLVSCMLFPVAFLCVAGGV